MANTKVFSGSQAGKVQYPYEAMVYIDGATVYAVDKEGNVISRGVAGTDDATVIQAAIDYISSGETLIINSGTYVPESKIDITKSITIVGSGEVIFHWYYPVASGNLFDCIGDIGSTYGLASDVASGDISVTYTGDLSGVVSCGDLIEIYDNTIWNLGNGGGYDTWKVGELHSVKSVSYAAPTTTITFHDALVNSYTTGQSAAISHIVPICVKFNGITCEGNDPNRNISMIAIAYGKNCKIENCSFGKTADRGMYFVRSYNSIVINCWCYDMDSIYDYYGTGEGGLGYGVSCGESNAYVLVEGCFFHNLRHGVACGGVYNRGQSREVAVRNSVFSAITSHAVDAHVGTESIIVDGNIIYCNGALDGVSSGARSTIVTNNKIYNADLAVTIRGYTNNRVFVIKNNYFDSCSYGFYSATGGVYSTYKLCVVSDNVCNSSRGRLVYVTDVENISITGNRYLADSTSTTGAISMTGSTNGNIENNYISNSNLSAIQIANSNKIVVCGNNCIDCNRANSAAVAYVLLEGTSSNVLVSNNFFAEITHLANSTLVVKESGTADCNIVTHNIIKNVSSSPITLTGADSMSDYNVIFTGA